MGRRRAGTTAAFTGGEKRMKHDGPLDLATHATQGNSKVCQVSVLRVCSTINIMDGCPSKYQVEPYHTCCYATH